MKYIATLVWGFILGHVAFYIGSALEGNAYHFVQASILGIVVALIIFLLTALIPETSKKAA